GVHADEFLFVNVGRTDEQKGLDLLVDALALLQDPRVKIVQVGDVTDGAARSRGLRYGEALRSKIRSAGLEQQFLWAGWRNDVPLLLQAANATVHCARWEGSPLAVLEAMAAEAAIVTTDNTSRPDGLEHETHGLIAAPDNPAALADAMRTMSRLPEERRKRLGVAARELALSRYDSAAVGSQFVDLVESVVTLAKQTTDPLSVSVCAGSARTTAGC
ncbi:MAG: glycosyltransferase, partial [Planctomycetaceae bacterium]|nr:glycosyltransferase [Planctomycetaceae bacterium]